MTAQTSTELVTDVAALYVDPRGPYPSLVAEWYDEARDARTYAGPWPVVAHPPCGPWGSFRVIGNVKQQRELAPIAVEQVRRWGGILEHPARSTLFRHCHLPEPGGLPDAHGGSTLEVDQVHWGHACRKPTWLYYVGIHPRRTGEGLRLAGGRATHVLSRDRRMSARDERPEASHEIRRRTPPAFARWLVELARGARRP